MTQNINKNTVINNPIKKIAFLGNFNVDFSSETHYLKTFRKMGLEVFPLQEGTDSVHQILSRATKMDMFFWVHTHGWNTEGMPEALQILKEQGIPTVGYHLDLWLGIDRQRDLETDPYWSIDYFFTVDNSMADLLNSREDMPKAFYLPAGVYEDECYIAEPDFNFKPEIIFVGSRNYHPEWEYRPKLIKWLEDTYGDRFAHIGPGSKYGNIRGKELNTLYSSAKIAIGDTLSKDFSYPHYLSDRIFETTGRGGFIIHPYIWGLEELFNIPVKSDNDAGVYDTSQTEVVTYPFNNFDRLKYLIDYYLQNAEERELIRRRAHQKTKSVHTYRSRLSYLLDTINEEKNSNQT